MKTLNLLLVLAAAFLAASCAGTERLPSNHLTLMDDEVYTHAFWRVKPGHEDAFVQAWTDLGDVFNSLERPPIRGTLLKSVSEPNVFYSFGPWRSAADVEAMRTSESARAALNRLRELCEESSPGMYRVVKHVEGSRK